MGTTVSQIRSHNTSAIWLSRTSKLRIFAQIRTIPRTLAAAREAMEAAGVEFLPDNGVRLAAGAQQRET
jgi:hypothetical protein